MVDQPGGTTTTVNGSSMSAGPSIVVPVATAGPACTGVSTQSVPKYTDRLAVGTVEAATAGGQPLGLRGLAPGHQAGAPDHGLLVAEGEAPVPLVLVVEAVGQIEQAGVVQGLALGAGHGHVEVLPGVRHLHEQPAGHGRG